MPRATWDSIGSRLYHVGVDRGMLYVNNTFAPWNGLVNVTEAPDGGVATPYYLDGQKVMNIDAGENFKGSIQAFSAPIEFAPCIGRGVLSPALYAADQPKLPFNFSYRTLIGNDLDGTSFAYRVHLVYNALAQNSDFVHKAITDSPSPSTYSWNIVTSPIAVPGRRPTAHLVFDTRQNGSTVMTALENILYGDISDDPRMPSATDLITLLSS